MLRRYIVAGVVVLLLVIAIFWALGRRGSRPQQDLSVKKESALVDYANTSTEVRYTLEGKINGRDEHRTIQITVGQNYRTATIFDGYQGGVLKAQTFGNDSDAYRAFLAALQNSGYTKTRLASVNVDPLGACPLEQRYHYDIISGADTKQSLWSTSCANIRGTFAGLANTVRTLFQAQVPDYDNFVKGITF